MNDRVPELSLVAGGVLAASLGGFAYWGTGDASQALLTAAVLLYPFAGYAVRHDDDPTTVLPPRGVAAAAAAAATLLLLDAVVTPGPAVAVAVLRAAWFALLVALPPAAYALRYGDPVGRRSGWLMLAIGGGVGLVLLVAGVAAGTPFGVAAAGIAALAGALGARFCGVAATETARLVAVAAGVVAGGAVLAAAALAGAVTTTVVVAASVAVLVPSLYAALSVETSAFD
ncbi:hypothetical protein [Halobaculum sp. D14]|uniref:hypothetical protein n=1 Tax=Halobaculum sp. D14 TaxID=3421642 RepID=UPI003EBF878A